MTSDQPLSPREAMAKLSQERTVAANKALLKIEELNREGALDGRGVYATLLRLQGTASIGAMVVALHTAGERSTVAPTDADFLVAAKGLWGMIPVFYRDTPELPDHESVVAYLTRAQDARRRKRR